MTGRVGVCCLGLIVFCGCGAAKLPRPEVVPEITGTITLRVEEDTIDPDTVITAQVDQVLRVDGQIKASEGCFWAPAFPNLGKSQRDGVKAVPLPRLKNAEQRKLSEVSEKAKLAGETSMHIMLFLRCFPEGLQTMAEQDKSVSGGCSVSYDKTLKTAYFAGLIKVSAPPGKYWLQLTAACQPEEEYNEFEPQKTTALREVPLIIE